MFTEGFPRQLSADAAAVVQQLPAKSRSDRWRTESPLRYTLLSGESVCFPYRVDGPDGAAEPPKGFSPVQQVIYHCILSRSYDGFVREAHIRALLELGPPHWAIPYIVKVCDEYVVEILSAVYQALSQQDTWPYREFCRRNLPRFVCSYCRMVSYWNEFYRTDCFHYRDYVGKALFEQCFGYTRSMAKAVRGGGTGSNGHFPP